MNESEFHYFQRVVKLKEFFHEIAEITLSHDVIRGRAVVYPSKLGEALRKVDPDWWKNRATKSPIKDA